jgi:hypothetical protein
MEKEKEMLKIKKAIQRVMGVDVHVKTRKLNFFYSKLMYVRMLRELHYTYAEISEDLGYTFSNAIHQNKAFDKRIKSKKHLYDKYLECKLIFEGNEILGQDVPNKIQLLIDKENEFKKYNRLLKIMKLIHERTPKGQEDFVEMKINRMFNGLTYDR